MPDALIYVPPSKREERHRSACLRRCEREGWPVVAIASDWPAVLGVWRTRPGAILVVAERGHLDQVLILDRDTGSGKGTRYIAKT